MGSLFVVGWFVCALIGWAIGGTKGRGGQGFALGLLLGFIGLIIIAVMRPAPTHSQSQPVYIQQWQQRQQWQQSQPGAWWPDPHRRHQMRYYDGVQWTHHVADNGFQSVDVV